MSQLATIETRMATAEELQAFAIAVRDQVPHLTESQLDELEATLVAVAQRLRTLGRRAGQAEASRVLTIRRIGDLLGPARTGRPKILPDGKDKTLPYGKVSVALTPEQMKRRHTARMFAQFSEFVDRDIAEDLAKAESDPDYVPRISVSRFVRLCQQRRSNRDVPMPDRLYSVIYVDPPWQYEGAESGTRQIENQYGTMSLDRLKQLGDRLPVRDDAVLFFWATSPKLADGLVVLKAWGFQYRTCMVWVKDKIGMGYYARQQHELLLIAKRGEPPVPKPANRPSSVFYGERNEHSSKPETVYELIEAMYPEYDRTDDTTDFCELFARTARKGWATWGLDTSI